MGCLAEQLESMSRAPIPRQDAKRRWRIELRRLAREVAKLERRRGVVADIMTDEGVSEFTDWARSLDAHQVVAEYEEHWSAFAALDTALIKRLMELVDMDLLDGSLLLSCMEARERVVALKVECGRRRGLSEREKRL